MFVCVYMELIHIRWKHMLLLIVFGMQANNTATQMAQRARNRDRNINKTPNWKILLKSSSNIQSLKMNKGFWLKTRGAHVFSWPVNVESFTVFVNSAHSVTNFVFVHFACIVTTNKQASQREKETKRKKRAHTSIETVWSVVWCCVLLYKHLPLSNSLQS